MDTQKGYEMQASIANAGFQNQAYLTGVAAEEARLRTNAQMANDNRNADRTNAMQEKALAVDVMKFERTLAAEEAKIKQAYSKNVMDNLIKIAMGEKVPPKDQAKLYSDLSTSSQISQQVAAWKKDHVDATTEQINEYKAKLVESEVDKITGMIQARARLDNQPWYSAILSGADMPATLVPDSEN
jgi:hypothetical protein